MSRSRRVLVLFASSWVAACAEGTGPPPSGASPQHARWGVEPSAFEYSVSYRPARQTDSGLPFARVAGPTPEAREVSFWAYQDRDAWVLVRYQSPDGTWRPYVELVVPSGALFKHPDGSLMAPGDSVFVTMTIDSTQLSVELEPTGLAFSALTPARLTLWYTGASPDFDGNGLVDSLDAYIEQTLLGLWLRVTPEDPWEAILATHSLHDQLFTATLQHFSGYAVAW